MMNNTLFSKNHIAVFTDGSSFIKGNYYEASSAVCITINGEEVCRFGCYHINGTNSLGELYAMMLAIDRVEEIKRDNPELQSYDTYYISDSKYVVESLRNWIFNWSRSGKNSIWKLSNGEPVLYQKFLKYIYYNYISNSKWRSTNYILHTNGHIDCTSGKKFIKAYNKAKYRNSKYIKSDIEFTQDDFRIIVCKNSSVDKLADYIRSNKISYFEERNETTWEIRKRKIPIRKNMIVIKSRKNINKN